MRLISILFGLAIIAFIVNKQLGSSSSSVDAESNNANRNTAIPKVPTAPEGVAQFEADMDKFMQDTEAERKKKLDETLGQ